MLSFPILRICFSIHKMVNIALANKSICFLHVLPPQDDWHATPLENPYRIALRCLDRYKAEMTMVKCSQNFASRLVSQADGLQQPLREMLLIWVLFVRARLNFLADIEQASAANEQRRIVLDPPPGRSNRRLCLGTEIVRYVHFRDELMQFCTELLDGRDVLQVPGVAVDRQSVDDIGHEIVIDRCERLDCISNRTFPTS